MKWLSHDFVGFVDNKTMFARQLLLQKPDGIFIFGRAVLQSVGVVFTKIVGHIASY